LIYNTAARERDKPDQLAARDGKVTRDALLMVALRQYQEFGYEATSLRKITEELGITVAAIYYYFSSKDELLVAAFQRNLEYLQMAHERCGEGLTAPERLWIFVQLHTRLQRLEGMTARQPFTASLLLQSLPAGSGEVLRTVMKGIRDRLRTIIADGVRARLFKNVSPTPTAYAIFGMSHQINTWFHPDGKLSLDQLASMYADFAVSVVGAKPIRNRAQLEKLVRSALVDAPRVEVGAPSSNSAAP
jgi:AcrR family transcriptional regulator